MSHLQYFDYPGFGARTRKEVHSSQAVRVGNMIKISGQGKSIAFDVSMLIILIPAIGGWDRQSEEISTDIDKQFDMTFDNVQHTLEHAGGKGWEQVYELRVYVTSIQDPRFVAAIIRNLRKWCPNHEPIMTVIGISELAFKNMWVEIEVAAHLG